MCLPQAEWRSYRIFAVTFILERSDAEAWWLGSCPISEPDFLLFFCDALVHSTTLSSLTLNVKYSLEEVFYDRPLSDVPTVSRDPSLKLRVEKIFVLPRILGGTAKSGFIRIEKKSRKQHRRGQVVACI